jgi:SAM-dependent methyltransferase
MARKEGATNDTLSPSEEIIYNSGERLIPGVTHDMRETIRHKSSYEFFKMVIERDMSIIQKVNNSETITIVDLGCGVGHGCQTLSKASQFRVTGVDCSKESLAYAQIHYAEDNIVYQQADLNQFIPEMQEFDYVVSRGVLEHIHNGLQLARSSKWRYRLLFDVPYDEQKGPNPHHLITGIREEQFSEYGDAEIFYQDLDGIVYDTKHKPAKPNMIMCVCSHQNLPKIGSMDILFPLPAWKP